MQTQHLAYLAVLAAVEAQSGVPFHAGLARAADAASER